MSELRKDPIIGRWVIISPERGKRPMDYNREPRKLRGGFCPFCPGNEAKTPAEVLAFREEGSKPNSPGWMVRVVPNRYPALKPDGEIIKRGEGLYDVVSGVGAHEVIIESPRHEDSLATMEVEHISKVLLAWKARIQHLKRDARFKFIMVFENHGESAGASLEHPHSQLVALPIVPKRVVEELNGSRSHYQLKERCIYCDILHQEINLNRKERIICENEHFISLAPFASRFPFEAWILPKSHCHAFEMMDDGLSPAAAEILKDLLEKINIVLGDPDYNITLHTSPFNNGENTEHFYHWHLEILPKLTKVAGFEWGTGFYINPTPPEDAARFLRDCSSPVDSRGTSKLPGIPA